MPGIRKTLGRKLGCANGRWDTILRFLFPLLCVVMVLAGCSGESGPPPAKEPEARLKLATTTSTDNSGLLKYLLPHFEAKHGCKVDVIAVGTGKALKLGENGDVDVLLVHARSKEDEFVAEGFGVDRVDVMHNDFVIIGPAEDPAGVKGIASAQEAFRRIAETEAAFCSRGDNSGTHIKEMEIWSAAGLSPRGRPWYIETGAGMGGTIIMATEKRSYCLVDRGTYIVFGSRRKTDLAVLVEGDPVLLNPYGVIAVNPEKHPHVKYELASKLIDFITSAEGQRLIGDFRVGGKTLFIPNARRK